MSNNSPENESSSATSVLSPQDPSEYSFAVTDPNWVPFDNLVCFFKCKQISRICNLSVEFFLKLSRNLFCTHL